MLIYSNLTQIYNFERFGNKLKVSGKNFINTLIYSNLTQIYNFERFGNKLKVSGKNFKDQTGNLLGKFSTSNKTQWKFVIVQYV